MVFQLTYSSTAVRPLFHGALVDLLEQSRAADVVRRVTGMLLFRQQRFLQLLEGDAAVVRALYATIAVDDRHTDLRILSEGRRLLRQFPTWTMAFRDLAAEPFPRAGSHRAVRGRRRSHGMGRRRARAPAAAGRPDGTTGGPHQRGARPARQLRPPASWTLR